MNNSYYFQPAIGRNQVANLENPYQGKTKKILCVCSAGLLRSPSLAKYLTNLGFNTRACGTSQEYALIPISEALVRWSDEIHVVEGELEVVNTILKRLDLSHLKVVSYDIPDQYETYSPELMDLIDSEYLKLHK